MMTQIKKIFILLLIFIPHFIKAHDFDQTDIILAPDYSFLGEQTYGRIGYYLSSAGDVNNDGYGDFMIGSYHNSEDFHGWNSGAVFLLLGGSDIDWQLNSSINVANAVFRGEAPFDFVGYNMAGEGDFNGDGIDDLLIGGPGNWERNPSIPGSMYIVFGNETPGWSNDCVLEDQADRVIIGEDNLDQFGYAVSFIGDLNQDGCDDILCAAPFRNQNNEWAGKVYLILGTSNNQNRYVQVTEIAVASYIYPEYHAKVGSAVAGVGDVNQDGYVDFLIGACGIGTSFLILGRPNLDWGFDFDLYDADCKFLPESPNYDDGGWQVKGVGDINNDGYSDFLISGLDILWGSGKVYLILGRKEWASEGMSLSQADASYIGEGANQQAGVSISGIKDFDGDGFNDFIIGSRYYKNYQPGSRDYHRGKAYIIKGKAGGWQRDVSLKDIDFYFLGEDSVSCAGWGVSSAGDVNGDCRNDIIVSSPFNDDGRQAGYYVGEVYLMLGDYPLNIVKGKTVYYTNDHPVSNVMLTLAGDYNFIEYSNMNGEYLFDVSGGNSFSITPSKQAFTDICKNYITIYDAALTAFHAVQLDTLNTLAQKAADVDLDGKITMYDATLIAYFAVKLPNNPESHVGEWMFNPESNYYQLSELPAIRQDYACILLGEVSGNWSADTSQIILSKNLLKDIKLSHQEMITFPVRVDSNLALISAAIHLAYDSKVLKFISANKTKLTNDFQIVYNDLNNGNIVIGMYGFSTFNMAGDILTIDFKIINKSMPETKIDLKRFQINDDKPIISETVINLTQFEGSNFKPENHLLKNYPNPFNPETIIEYQINSATDIKLIILNIMGCEVKILDSGFKQPGRYKVNWSGVDNTGEKVSSGLYICNLKYDGYSFQTKMLKLK